MKRKIVSILALFLLAVSFAAPVSARNYDLDLPYPVYGSMRSTRLETKTSYATPYVNQEMNSIATCYLLSPKRESSTMATHVVTITYGRRNLEYLSGYG